MTIASKSARSTAIASISRRSRRQTVAVSVSAMVTIVFFMTFRLAVVRGESMLPAYHDGQWVLVNRLVTLGGPLRKGDVVLVKTANDVLIKRIAYLPGDAIGVPEVFRFRRVRDYFEVERPREGPGYPNRLKVPPGYVVVLGDNRAASEDSRAFGPIAVGDILGRVINAPPQ